MSAPNAGRQSPPPSEQSGRQQSGVHDANDAGSGSENQDASKETLENLPSNPKGALAEKAKDQTSKGSVDASQGFQGK